MNIKSLPKHHNEREIYLDSLHVKFSFIVLSETWLDVFKHELYDINGYCLCIDIELLEREEG